MNKYLRKTMTVVAVLVLVVSTLVIGGCRNDNDESQAQLEASVQALEAQVAALEGEIAALRTQLSAQNVEFNEALDLVTSGVIQRIQQKTSLPAGRSRVDLVDVAVETREQIADLQTRLAALE